MARLDQVSFFSIVSLVISSSPSFLVEEGSEAKSIPKLFDAAISVSAHHLMSKTQL